MLIVTAHVRGCGNDSIINVCFWRTVVADANEFSWCILYSYNNGKHIIPIYSNAPPSFFYKNV